MTYKVQDIIFHPDHGFGRLIQNIERDRLVCLYEGGEIKPFNPDQEGLKVNTLLPVYLENGSRSSMCTSPRMVDYDTVEVSGFHFEVDQLPIVGDLTWFKKDQGVFTKALLRFVEFSREKESTLLGTVRVFDEEGTYLSTDPIYYQGGYLIHKDYDLKSIERLARSLEGRTTTSFGGKEVIFNRPLLKLLRKAFPLKLGDPVFVDEGRKGVIQGFDSTDKTFKVTTDTGTHKYREEIIIPNVTQ